MSEDDASAIIREFNGLHGTSDEDVLFVSRMRESGLDSATIAKILEILMDTCPACFDNQRGCVCWRDE